MPQPQYWAYQADWSSYLDQLVVGPIVVLMRNVYVGGFVGQSGYFLDELEWVGEGRYWFVVRGIPWLLLINGELYPPGGWQYSCEGILTGPE